MEHYESWSIPASGWRKLIFYTNLQAFKSVSIY
jgi:hypothetical protein